jgi:hypothetical protein
MRGRAEKVGDARGSEWPPLHMYCVRISPPSLRPSYERMLFKLIAV